MTARTLDGRTIELEAAAVDALKLQHKGPILQPGDPGYDESRTIWNAMIDRRPALVARCLGAADVRAAVNFARERNLLLCVKGGGHNIAGLAVADGGLLLDLGLMRGVFVDPAKRVARAQGGCLLGDVDRETQLHGLVAVLGFVSATGIAGLTLGGGFGYLTRRFGWTTDNVLGFELITADGRVVTATPRENLDLFWGLCGGGGNFGVVTRIDYALHRVGPEVVGGVVAWPAEEAEKVLALHRELTENAPRELSVVALMRPAPPAPWLPKERHGTPIVALLACWSGDPAEGEKVVAPIKAFGKPIGDILVRRPYTQLNALLDGTQPKGRRYYWKSEYLPGLSAELADGVRAQAAAIQSPHSAVILFPVGGALNEQPEAYSPAGNRDAKFVLNIAGSWEKPEDDARNLDWARSAWESLRGFGTGGNYINFLTEDESPERVAAALGGNRARLAEVKKAWDPDNFFRTNRNIAPGH
jgi:FAD/FMN-containing dehydrogenase